MRTTIRCVALAVLSLLLAGCFETFSLVNTDYRPKGRSIAVVSGLDSEANVAVAERLTAALQKHTRLHVMSYRHVEKSLPKYPTKIKGPYLFAYFEIEEDYGHTDLDQIRHVQRKLGVDYLYVVWAPTATVTQGTIEQLHCIGQLFAGPSSQEIGHGKFMATAGNVGGCCLVPAPTDKDRSKAVDNVTDIVAREIGEKLGMLKEAPAR